MIDVNLPWSCSSRDKACSLISKLFEGLVLVGSPLLCIFGIVDTIINPAIITNPVTPMILPNVSNS